MIKATVCVDTAIARVAVIGAVSLAVRRAAPMARCHAGHVAIGGAACVDTATARVTANGAVCLADGRAALLAACHAAVLLSAMLLVWPQPQLEQAQLESLLTLLLVWAPAELLLWPAAVLVMLS